jgi:RNA polymerase sigma-70 factor, ECF subfamily
MPHLAALLRVARRLTLESASAEDLVQETMLLAWRGFHGFQSGTNARAWLFRILFNAFHGAKRKARVETVPAKDSVRPMLQEAVEIAEALDALSLEQRTVLLLAAVEGFTCQEIAGILELPMGTVMSRLSRARQELRKSLKPLAKEAYR